MNKKFKEDIYMRTYISNKGTLFNYHSDMSGDVTIRSKDQKKKFVIPADCLLEFVANYISCKKLYELEHMSAKEILGIK